MMHTTLRFLALFTALLMFGGEAEAKKVKIKHGTLAPKDSPWFNGMKKVGERWKKASDGDVRLTIYPGGIAGDEGDMLRKMKIGQLHAATLTAIGLGRITRSTVALQIPMAFQSYDELDHVRAKISPKLEAELAKAGFKVLNWGDAGWVHFFSKDKAISPDEVRKLKLFVWSGDPESEAAWKSSNFKVVPMSSTDVLSGLQTGLVETFATAPVYALTSQWFGLAKHMVAIKWSPLNGATIVTLKQWNKIPEALRPTMAKIAKEEGEAVRTEVRNLGTRAIEEMKKRGLTVHPVDPALQAEWQKAAEKAFPAIRGKVVPAPLFDEVIALTKSYRQRQQ